MFDDVYIIDPDDGRLLNKNRPATPRLQRLEMIYLRVRDAERASPTTVERVALMVEGLPLSEREAGERLCQLIAGYVDWSDPEFTRQQEFKLARGERIRQVERAKRVAQTYTELLGRKKSEVTQQ